MLARTDNPQRGEQGPPHQQGRHQDAENANCSYRLCIEGSEEAGQALTLDFPGLVDTLKSLPDPDEEAEAYYEPGLALLHTLINQSEDFGTAASGVAPNAPLAEQFLGITDEAFEKAHAVLEALSDELGPAYTADAPIPQLHMFMYRLGTVSTAEDRRRLLWIRPAAEPSMGGEFY